jgi:hypothetical protein
MTKYVSKDFKLLKSFVHSEFFFQQKFLKKKYSNKNLKKVYFLQKDSLSIINPSSSIKSIKQLIRLFQFFKVSKKPELQLIINNRPYDFLLYFFLKKHNLKIPSIKTYLDSDLVKDSKNSKIVLALNCLLNTRSDIFYKSDKIFNILYKINACDENKFFPNYKLHNDVDSFKKFIYILILLKHSLKASKAVKKPQVSKKLNLVKKEEFSNLVLNPLKKSNFTNKK